MTDLEILQLLVKAKELGISKEDVEAYKAGQETKGAWSQYVDHQANDPKLKEDMKRAILGPIEDLKANEIIVPISPFDDLSDDEVLYWHSPFYDDIQTRKEAQKKKLAENTHE